MVLHNGNISEMKTGEGKTLVATLPTYLNALAGDGVHVVTVNDYLAKRDSEWMGQVYRFLGMSVDCIVHGLDDAERKAAYGADITYGTNNEFGFDYLRDNMKYSLDTMTQRGHAFAIVDEVDSILIDEARTPADHFRPHRGFDRDVPRGGCGDGRGWSRTITTWTRNRAQVSLTETGNEHMSELLKAAGMLEKRRSV